MNTQDSERLNVIRNYGNNETVKMAEWCWDLFNQNQTRKAARVLRAAEHMLIRRNGGVIMASHYRVFTKEELIK